MRENGDEPMCGSAREVFAAFLKLGLTSFGGPIAHLGYFRQEFVQRRRWLDEDAYGDLVALCQFLPGPASSQVGFALGLMRAGWLGALAAFAAFTLPSALALTLFAFTATNLDSPLAFGALDGLKIVAVAIVAQAVWGMAVHLCPDRARSAIAVLAVAVLAVLTGPLGMVAAIVLGAGIGLAFCRASSRPASERLATPVSPVVGSVALTLCAALLLLLPLLGEVSPALALVKRFARAGSLVFGGGHVVLPLLDAEMVQSGLVAPDIFLAGYGAAQAVPGPLFTFAAYLGAVPGHEPDGALGAALALLSIFLPGFLILVGVLPFWDALRALAPARSAMAGINAAVVGILGAALYSPIFTGAIADGADLALALACFTALTVWKAPPWIVVLFASLCGAALALVSLSL